MAIDLVREEGVVTAGPVVLRDGPVKLIGGRQFWAGRIPADADHAEVDAALNAAFDALDAEHVRGQGPIGIAVVLDPAAVAARPADVFWRDTKLLYAGYRADGHQVRVRYFHLALCIEPGPEGPFDYDPADRERIWALSDEYEVHDVDDGAVTREQIVALWKQTGVVVGDELERRLDEVRAVGTTRSGELVAIGSAYRVRHAQTRLELWAARVFVASDHRRSNLARQVNGRTLDLVTANPEGADGLLTEMENVAMRKRLARAVRPTRPFTFIGARSDGATVYVSYFPGVQAPPPPVGG